MKKYQRSKLSLKYKEKFNNKKIYLLNEFDGNIKKNLNYKNNIEDDRLMYVLVTLGLGNLIFMFNEKKISFIDLLLTSKQTLKDLGLEIYQRNRIHNFSTRFNKYAKTYSIKEISKFFSFNKQFLFNPSIYNKMIKKNKSYNFDYDRNNNSIENYKYENINFTDDDVDENNYIIGNKLIMEGPLTTSRIRKRKIKLSINKINNKAKKIFKKYLLIKKGVNKFLNKLDKPKEVPENMAYKNNNYIKRINNENYNFNNYNINKVNKLNYSTFKNSLYKNNNSNKKIINKYDSNYNNYKNSDFNYNNNYNNYVSNEQNDDNLILLENSQNNNSYYKNDKDINDEFDILIEKMKKLEKMPIDGDSLEFLNQIKNYIEEKGGNIMIDDIISLQNEIDKIIEILIKKEEIKKIFEKYNQKIEKRKQI